MERLVSFHPVSAKPGSHPLKDFLAAIMLRSVGLAKRNQGCDDGGVWFCAESAEFCYQARVHKDCGL